MSKWIETELGLFDLSKFFKIELDDGVNGKYVLLGYLREGDRYLITENAHEYWDAIVELLNIKQSDSEEIACSKSSCCKEEQTETQVMSEELKLVFKKLIAFKEESFKRSKLSCVTQETWSYVHKRLDEIINYILRCG